MARQVALALLVLVASGCKKKSVDDFPDGGREGDAGVPPGLDGGMPTPDAGPPLPSSGRITAAEGGALASEDVTKSARVRVVDIFAVRVADLLEGQSEPMHGDEVDTSILLHIAPHLVRMELAEDYMISREALRKYRRGWLRVPKGSSGSIGRPSLASAAKGRAIYDRIRSRIRERIFIAPPEEE